MRLKVNYCGIAQIWWIVENPLSTIIEQVILDVKKYLEEQRLLTPKTALDAEQSRDGSESNGRQLVMKFNGYIVPSKFKIGQIMLKDSAVE